MAENGPSIAHSINAERLMLLGWTRAILMQIAHPLVAAGVARHSTFRSSPTAPVRRLHETVRAMLGITFGSVAEQTRVIAAIRDIHTRVRGTLSESVGLYPAGTVYSAEDPALVLWVHATLIDTTVMTYEALVRPLSSSERDAYCATSAAVAIALGAQKAAVPTDWPGMSRYVTTMLDSGTLAVGSDAATVSRELLSGAAIRATGPVGWMQRELTIAWLPEPLRREYKLTWDARRERRARRLAAGVRRLRGWMPSSAAHWAAARRRVPA